MTATQTHDAAVEPLQDQQRKTLNALRLAVVPGQAAVAGTVAVVSLLAKDLLGGSDRLAGLGSAAFTLGAAAVSIPLGAVDGLPVGLQAIGRHHEDALLLDLALHVERERPWPLVAPGAPA